MKFLAVKTRIGFSHWLFLLILFLVSSRRAPPARPDCRLRSVRLSDAGLRSTMFGFTFFRVRGSTWRVLSSTMIRRLARSRWYGRRMSRRRFA